MCVYRLMSARMPAVYRTMLARMLAVRTRSARMPAVYRTMPARMLAVYRTMSARMPTVYRTTPARMPARMPAVLMLAVYRTLPKRHNSSATTNRWRNTMPLSKASVLSGTSYKTAGRRLRWGGCAVNLTHCGEAGEGSGTMNWRERGKTMVEEAVARRLTERRRTDNTAGPAGAHAPPPSQGPRGPPHV